LLSGSKPAVIGVFSTTETRLDPTKREGTQGVMTEPIKLEIFTDYV
jgi:hypothetical protein